MSKITEEAIQRFLDNGNKRGGDFAANTIWRYRLDLEDFFNFIGKDFTEVSRRDCEDYKSHLKNNGKNLSKKSIWHRIAAIKSFYRYAIESGDFKGNNPMYFKIPSKDMKTSQAFIEEQILSRQEVRNLLNATKSPRDNAILTVLYNTGCRISELTGLDLDSVNMEKKTMTLNGKTGERTIDFNGDIYQSLKLWILVRGRPKTDALFTTKFGNRIEQGCVRGMIRKQCKKVGISRRIICHSFRHTMITHALEDNVNLVELSKFVGHTDVNTTISYCAIAKLGNTIQTKFQGIHKEE